MFRESRNWTNDFSMIFFLKFYVVFYHQKTKKRQKIKLGWPHSSHLKTKNFKNSLWHFRYRPHICTMYMMYVLSAWSRQPRALDENLKLGERIFKTLYNLSLTKLDDLYIYIWNRNWIPSLGNSRLWCSGPVSLTSGACKQVKGSIPDPNEKNGLS